MRSPESWSTSPGARILRALNATIGLGRPFGVEVRIFVIALVLMPLFIWSDFSRTGLPAGQSLFAALLVVTAMYATIWLHEMGHIVAGWRYHIPTPLITLSPLGGLAHLSAPAPNPRADIVVSLAGPATHLVGLLFWWLLSLVVTPDTLRPEGWGWSPAHFLCDSMLHLNGALLLFNLLPCFPMDGGRVLLAALTMRREASYAMRRTGQVGMVGGSLFIVFGLLGVFHAYETPYGSWFGWILALIGLTVVLACRQLLAAARMSMHGPYGERREAWQGDPDAWKQGGGFSGSAGGGMRPPSARSAKRAEKKAAQAQERARADAQELDRLLQRVSDVGLAGLSSKERARLKALSERQRMR